MQEGLVTIRGGRARLTQIGGIKHVYRRCKKLNKDELLSLLAVVGNKKNLRQRLTKKKKKRHKTRRFRKRRHRHTRRK